MANFAVKVRVKEFKKVRAIGYGNAHVAHGMPLPAILALIEELQTAVERNELVALAYATVHRNGFTRHAWASEPGNRHAMNASVMYLLHEMADKDTQ